jgi:hypothetical protein
MEKYNPMNTSRRAFLGNGLAALAAAQTPIGSGAATEEMFVGIIIPP